MKKAILILSMIFPAFAYGKFRPIINKKEQTVTVPGRKGKPARVFPYEKNVSIEVQERAGTIAGNIDNEYCVLECYRKLKELATTAEESEGGIIDQVVESMEYTGFKQGQDARVVSETVGHVADYGYHLENAGFFGYEERRMAGALISAANDSEFWDDVEAQDAIPALAEAKKEVAEAGQPETLATQLIFDETQEEAQKRDEDIKNNCLEAA